MSLDLGRPALLSMEMQRGVVGDRSRIRPLIEAVDAVGLVPNLAGMMRRARAAGVTVVHCNAEFRADLKGSGGNCPLLAAMTRRPDHILEGSEGAEVDQRLEPSPQDIVLRRFHGVSPFTGSTLDMTLRNLGVDTVIATGVSVNMGVLGMCIEAANLGYRVLLPRDAVAGFPADYATAVIDNSLALVATITDSAAVMAALATMAPAWEMADG
ncbi:MULTISPECIES: cysteine hydrolase family protein [unclassified Sphingomonas]|uniref:cysteine hydrolase family protein n=1 Tax=unclassified Sphingomonas TaxID=196159 RepID=UPI0006F54508|nr:MULTISPECIES: cysteine hydrolase [unclassified Sphingomonas]KQX17636.1 isochorismatase [Sphingomonas sp. Root1294]KQY70562.1 isochorismatase [Sphingomonas sp. Root50]KRB91950.1 isochorismatase [Sphingomonas sp. Root720]